MGQEDQKSKMMHTIEVAGAIFFLGIQGSRRPGSVYSIWIGELKFFLLAAPGLMNELAEIGLDFLFVESRVDY